MGGSLEVEATNCDLKIAAEAGLVVGWAEIELFRTECYGKSA